MPRLPKHPAAWFSALICWLGLLWFVSSRPGMGGGPDIDHLDKVAHFGFFLAGGFLFAGCHFQIRPENSDWKRIIFTAVIAMAVIGWLDEWHQTHVPGRNGGDVWDWLADLLGGMAGALSAKHFLQRRK